MDQQCITDNKFTKSYDNQLELKKTVSKYSLNSIKRKFNNKQQKNEVLETVRRSFRINIPGLIFIPEEIVIEKIKQSWTSQPIKKFVESILTGDGDLYNELLKKFLLNSNTSNKNKIYAIKYLLDLMRCYSDCLEEEGIKFMFCTLKDSKSVAELKEITLDWISNCLEHNNGNRLKLFNCGLLDILFRFINHDVNETLLNNACKCIFKLMNYKKDHISLILSRKLMPKFVFMLSQTQKESILKNAITAISFLLVTVKSCKRIVELNASGLICYILKNNLQNKELMFICFLALKNLSRYDKLKKYIMLHGASKVIFIALEAHKDSPNVTIDVLSVMWNLCFHCKRNCILFTEDNRCETVIEIFQKFFSNKRISYLICKIISVMSQYYDIARLVYLNLDAGALLRETGEEHIEFTSLTETAIEILYNKRGTKHQNF